MRRREPGLQAELAPRVLGSAAEGVSKQPGTKPPHTTRTSAEFTQNCHRRSTELPAPNRSRPRQPQLRTPTRPLPGALRPPEAAGTRTALISAVRAEFAGWSPVPLNGEYPKGCKSPAADSPGCQHAAMPLPRREPADADSTAVRSPNLQGNLKKPLSLQMPPLSPPCCSLPTLQTQLCGKRSWAGAVGSPGDSRDRPSAGVQRDRRGADAFDLKRTSALPTALRRIRSRILPGEGYGPQVAIFESKTYQIRAPSCIPAVRAERAASPSGGPGPDVCPQPRLGRRWRSARLCLCRY